MSALVFLFVVESFVFGAMWHNKSPQSEREQDSKKTGPGSLVLPYPSARYHIWRLVAGKRRRQPRIFTEK